MLGAPYFLSGSSVLDAHTHPHKMNLPQELLVTFGDMLFPDAVCRRSVVGKGFDFMSGLILLSLSTRG